MCKPMNLVLMLSLLSLSSGCLHKKTAINTKPCIAEHIDALGTPIASKPEHFHSVYDENLGEFTEQTSVSAWNNHVNKNVDAHEQSFVIPAEAGIQT